MKRVGFIGWRGLVGSVLRERITAEKGDEKFFAFFFSTSQAGERAPSNFVNSGSEQLLDAYELPVLFSMDILVSCQGSAYTQKIYLALRKMGWSGYWLDTASWLRMRLDSIIVLDPVNHDLIENGLNRGIKTFVGGNCTISLLLMAIGELFKEALIEWVTMATYQAVSGAGTAYIKKWLDELAMAAEKLNSFTEAPETLLSAERIITATLQDSNVLTGEGPSLLGNVIPWIDSAEHNGQTREESKGSQEAEKILGWPTGSLLLDGICGRVGALRAHSQAVTIKLTKTVEVATIMELITRSAPWVRVVANTEEETRKYLTPVAVSGKLDIRVGRIRPLTIGPTYLSLFTVGDQLLWGAAEPIRCMLARLMA